MDKSTKIILLAAGGIALVGGTIFLLTRNNKNSNSGTLPPKTQGGTQAQPQNTFTVNNGNTQPAQTTQVTQTTQTTTANTASTTTANVQTGQQTQSQQNTSTATPPSTALTAIRAIYALNSDMNTNVESALLGWESKMIPVLNNRTPRYDNPRGYRNNNPGNIRHNPQNNWNGMTGQDAEGFCKFSDRKYGYRAMVRILKNYQLKHSNPSYITLAEKIGRWAPESDNNNTSGYIEFVSALTGIDPNASIGVNNAAQLCTMVYAMAIVENGYAPLPSMAEIIAGYKMEKS